ncbi:General transcription factor 3C polypeptide [Dirofilaria immitis]
MSTVAMRAATAAANAFGFKFICPWNVSLADSATARRSQSGDSVRCCPILLFLNHTLFIRLLRWSKCNWFVT